MATKERKEHKDKELTIFRDSGPVHPTGEGNGQQTIVKSINLFALLVFFCGNLNFGF